MPSYSFLKTDLINTTENDSSEYESQISKLNIRIYDYEK